MELADVLFVVICLANSQGIDLDDAFRADDAKGHLPRRRSLDQEGTLTFVDCADRTRAVG